MADLSQNIVQSTPNVKASYWFHDVDSDWANVDMNLFTHLFCAYAHIDPHTYKVTTNNTNLANLPTSTNPVLRKKHGVKSLLSISAKDGDYNVFALMASNADNRKMFIDSSIQQAWGFRGIDLAWMYPKNEVEMYNFGTLLEEWRTVVKNESQRDPMLPSLLTATVYYSPYYNSHSYPIKAIAENLDWVNIISYNLCGPGSSGVTGPPAPLYDRSNAAGLSVDSGLSQWLTKLPANKIVLGLPFFGWAWSLKDTKINGYDAPTDGPAITADGSISYNKLRDYIADDESATFYDPTLIGHYCNAGKTWIGYDDNQSIVSKVKYAKEKGLLGYFSYHVQSDISCHLSRAASDAWDTRDVTTGE